MLSPENGPDRPKLEDSLSDMEKEKLRAAGLVPESTTEHQAADSEKTARIEEITGVAFQAEQQALEGADLLTQGYEEYSRRLREAGDKALAKIDELTRGDKELKKAVLKRRRDERDAEMEERLKNIKELGPIHLSPLEMVQEPETENKDTEKEKPRQAGLSSENMEARPDTMNRLSNEEIAELLRQVLPAGSLPPTRRPEGVETGTKTETEQTNPHVETAFKIYEETLKETGDDAKAQDKAWGKIMELTGNDLDPSPFNQLAEKMEQAAKQREGQAEIKEQELKDKADRAVPAKPETSPVTETTTSEPESSTPTPEPPKPDIIIDRTPAEKAADVSISPPENLPVADTTQTKPETTLQPPAQEAWLEAAKELRQIQQEKEAALEQTTNTIKALEYFLQDASKHAGNEKVDPLIQQLKDQKAALELGAENLARLQSPSAINKFIEQTQKSIEESGGLIDALSKAVTEIGETSPSQPEEAAAEQEQALNQRELAKQTQAAENVDFTDIPGQELQAIKELVAMPEAEREKIGLGFNNLGFYIKEKTNSWLAENLNKIGGKIEKEGSTKRFLAALAETFNRDGKEAQQKLDDTQKGQTHKLTNAAYLGGLALKWGRNVADVIGWTAASPLRGVTIGAQILGRGTEAIKEARLKNEEVINKTRIEDIDAASEEAWKIYEAAQAKAVERNEEKVIMRDLEKAYRESLPADLLKRLQAKPETGSGENKIEPGIAEKVIQGTMKFHIEQSVSHLKKQIDEIEQNPKLNETQKAAQTENLYGKYARRLDDYDRVLSQWGAVDAIAMAARYGETGSKMVVKGVMVESLYLSLDKVAHYLADSLDKVGGVTEAIEHPLKFAKQALGLEREPADVSKAPTRGEHTERQKQALEKYRQKFAEKFAGPAPKPEITPSQTEPTPSAKHFEDIIDSSKVAGSDSIWKSTREIFTGHAQELGYKGSLDDKAALDKWAETQTANSIKELADKEYGGKIPDLVHGPTTGGAGDKVVVEIGGDGKPHLKFEASSGIKPGYLEHEEIKPETPETTKPQESQEIKPPVRLDEPTGVQPPPAVEGTGIKPPETTPSEIPAAGSPGAKLKEAYEASPDRNRQLKAVKDYLEKTVAEPENKIIYPKNRLYAFARMFPVEGVAAKIENMDTPAELARALKSFDGHIAAATRTLLRGDLQQMTKDAAFFPVEGKNHELYFTQSLGKGEWWLWRLDDKDRYLAAKLTPNKEVFKFNLDNLKEFLDYTESSDVRPMPIEIHTELPPEHPVVEMEVKSTGHQVATEKQLPPAGGDETVTKIDEPGRQATITESTQTKEAEGVKTTIQTKAVEGTLSGEMTQKIHQASFELAGVTDKDKFMAQVENVKGGKLTQAEQKLWDITYNYAQTSTNKHITQQMIETRLQALAAGKK